MKLMANWMVTARLATAALLCVTVVSPALAASGDDEMDKLLDKAAEGDPLGGWADRMAERPRTFPYIKHHGYFRFRGDFFHNGHLSTVIPGDDKSGTSGIDAPLTENAANNDDPDIAAQVGTEDAKVIASANIRFRYAPIIHVAESLRIHTTIDILDNIVLGSTPDFAGNGARPDVPLSAFVGSAAPPSSGVNGFRDGIRIKEAFAEFQPAFLLRVGRMKSHWGLGILANGGSDVDDDFGDYADRAMILLKLYDVYITAAWDFVYSGAVSDDPTQNFGQPKDLGNADDVQQWVVAFFQRPLSEKEKAERLVATTEKFKPAFDWGVYGVFRQQDFDLDLGSFNLVNNNGGGPSFDQIGLVPRDAWAFIPDLWLRFEQHFDFHSSLRVELELAGIFGEVGSVDNELNANLGKRTIQQFGGALEVEYSWRQLNVGIHTGFATGDSAEGFGVLDRNTLAEVDGSPNTDVTAFKFDRDYQVDLLLFREVIGTITNTFYAKPYVSYDFFDSPEDALGARLDLLVATALEPEATPGNASFLGFESDIRLFYHDKSGFMFDLEAGLLFPGAALNYRPVDNLNNREAEFAFTLQTRLTMSF